VIVFVGQWEWGKRGEKRGVKYTVQMKQGPKKEGGVGGEKKVMKQEQKKV